MPTKMDRVPPRERKRMRPSPGATGQPPPRTEPQWVVCEHFVLIAAMNPCPYGYYGDPERECTRAKTRILDDHPLPEAHLGPDSYRA